jgi:hypothetical protein
VVHSVVKALRAFDREFDLWKRIAALRGLSFNAWARKSLNDQAALDEVLLREDLTVSPTMVQSGYEVEQSRGK